MNSGSPYLSNKTQSQFGSIIEPNSMGISTTQVSEPPKMNIFAEFINKILDKINPNINKRDRQFDPYNAQIQQPKTYIGELNIEPNDKINQNSNLNNQLNNVITKKQTDDNTKTTEDEKKVEDNPSSVPFTRIDNSIYNINIYNVRFAYY